MKYYTWFVLAASMVVQIVFSTLITVKLSFMGNPFDKIIKTIKLDGGMEDEDDNEDLL